MFKVSWKVIILMLMERIIKGIKLTKVKIIACSIAVAGVADF
ncbi:hypothetical protein [Eubacterium sp. 1001713B170207_170306_E7]|nr:hypothetical protein [Eubacterium sp. 1001713B170207_170306_E7]